MITIYSGGAYIKNTYVGALDKKGAVYSCNNPGCSVGNVDKDGIVYNGDNPPSIVGNVDKQGIISSHKGTIGYVDIYGAVYSIGPVFRGKVEAKHKSDRFAGGAALLLLLDKKV